MDSALRKRYLFLLNEDFKFWDKTTTRIESYYYSPSLWADHKRHWLGPYFSGNRKFPELKW